MPQNGVGRKADPSNLNLRKTETRKPETRKPERNGAKSTKSVASPITLRDLCAPTSAPSALKQLNFPITPEPQSPATSSSDTDATAPTLAPTPSASYSTGVPAVSAK